MNVLYSLGLVASLCVQHLPGAGLHCVGLEVSRGGTMGPYELASAALWGANSCGCKDFHVLATVTPG